ncbi:MAG TPA: hypothetical protein VLJ42_06370 [Solirubrobacteraceae bacterium]|nr:hypothetical protein [Solirubrobacteraceae bacterium]
MALPVKLIDSFAGQNWLITPAALALNEAPPADVHAQKWLLTLSGVAYADVEGNSDGSWRRETLLLEPTVIDPMHYAIAHHSIPEPPGSEGAQYSLAFEVEQLAPFASISSVFDAHESIDAGFAVDSWRPNHWGSGIDVFTHQYAGTLFSGLKVDVAVRDGDAWLYRVGYNIALLGKIVFLTAQKTLFQSNFDPTPVGEPPSPTQEIGSAKVEGPPRSVIVVNPPAPPSDKWVQISRPNGPEIATLDCLLTETPGPGLYMFSAEIFLSETSGTASISFETTAGEEFLHVDFLPNNQARVDDVGAEFGSLPRPGAFIVQVALDIQLSQSTATVVLTGSASGAQNVTIQPALQHLAPQFGAVRIWQGFPNVGEFKATNISVTRSPY